MTDTFEPDWMNDTSMQEIPEEKREYLKKLYLLSMGKTQKELLTTLLPLLKEAREKGFTFTPEEMNLAISSLKKHSTDAEWAKMTSLLNKTTKKEI